MWASLLAVALIASSTDVPPPANAHRGWDVLALPVLNYTSDTGFGFGALANAYFYDPNHQPYQHALSVQTFFTTTGIQTHFIGYDGPRLLGPFRLEAHGEFHRELRAPFYGPGNTSAENLAPEPGGKLFSYPGRTFIGWVRLRVRPWGETHPFELHGGYRYEWTGISPYPVSVLAQLAPAGSQGGKSPSLFAGMSWDSRDNEVDAARGGYREASFRISRHAFGSQFNYQGLFLNLRQYISVFTPRIVLAFNAAFDHLFGDVPFWKWVEFGGINGFEGVGGAGSVRGVPRDRYQGNTKLFANAELRVYPAEFELWGAPLKVGLDAFFDTGRVWHPAVPGGDLISPGGWHSGTGAGLRLARRAALLRFDYGVELGTGRTGFYIAFGQLF